MKTFAIIPAAGIGKRIDSPVPKQFVKINGKEIIAHTISVFQNHKEISEIIIATRKEYFDLLDEIKNRFGFTKLTQVVEGGAERQDSVYSALNSVNAEDTDLIAVHDAARPLLSTGLLTSTISAAKKFGAVVTAVKAKDTLIVGNDDKVESYLDRDKIYYAQTPQIFRYDILMTAMKKSFQENFSGTDESMLVRKFYGDVKIVEGEAINFKITTNSDLEIFRKILS